MHPRTSSWDPTELVAHTSWIRSLALRLVRDAGRADDLVQETLLAAIQQQPTRGRSLRPWLRGVLAKRVAFGRRSDARRTEREVLSAPSEGLPSSFELAERAETHARLVQALTRLREPYRNALLLRYYEGLAPKEIARRLGTPSATVRSHLKRGLVELRERLDAEHEGDRRAWCLTLAPLAAVAPEAWTFANPLASVLQPLRAMHPLVHVAVVSSALLLVGSYVADRLGGDAPVAPELEAGFAGVVGEPAAVGELPAPKSGSSRAAGSDTVEPGTRGGTTSALVSADEVVVGFVRSSEGSTPLPDFAVRLRILGDESEGELLWTDESGRFESSEMYAAGTKLNVVLIDHPDLTQVSRSPRQVLPSGSLTGATATWSPETGPLQFKALVGPTYPLLLSAAVELDPSLLTATLEPSQRDPWGPLSHSNQLRAPIRLGATPWTRFGWAKFSFVEGRPWLLGVESADGLWAGAVEIAAAAASPSEPIAIELVPVARLAVEVTSETEYRDLVVSARSMSDGAHRILWSEGSEDLDNGLHAYRFQLRALPAGDYQLSVSSEGSNPVETSVTLIAGQVLEKSIALAASLQLSHLRGELRSLSGQYKKSMTLFAIGLATGTETRHMPTWELQDDVWVAPFEFDNLPVDTYSLRLYSLDDNLHWDTLPAEFAPPKEGIVLTCRDTEAVRDVVIEVKDAASGARIPLASASLEVLQGATPQMLAGGGGRLFIQKVPVDASLSWWAQAPGHIPQFGDESALVVTDGKGWIEVALASGWGARVEVFDKDTRQPLAGVAVLLDGVAAGTTDAAGRLDLVAESAPTHLDFELDGWRFASGGYDPASRVLEGFGPVYSIVMSDEP